MGHVEEAIFKLPYTTCSLWAFVCVYVGEHIKQGYKK